MAQPHTRHTRAQLQVGLIALILLVPLLIYTITAALSPRAHAAIPSLPPSQQFGHFKAESGDQPVFLALDNAPMVPSTGGVTVSLTLDDGTAEEAIGDAGQFVWINRFTPAPSEFPMQLHEVWVMFGSNGVPSNGAVQLVIHEDLDGDGNPGTGATLRGTFNTTIQTTTAGQWSVYTLPEPIEFNTPGDILIGVVNRYSSEGTNDFPARLDETASAGRSWAASYLSGNAPSIPSYPADEQWGTIDSFGFPGNWMIRGVGTTVKVTPTPTATETPSPTDTPTATETPTATLPPTITSTPTPAEENYLPLLRKD